MYLSRLATVSIFLCATLGISARTFAMYTDENPLVKTHTGEVKGVKEKDIFVWKGIPYAEAPVGELRYQNPQPVKKWNGVYDATKFRTVCPQRDGLLTYGEKKDEDCLFLNVWSPAADGKKRPVMFWIHGGGFMSGSGSSDMYDGANLVKKGDIVLVTINYRLGPLAFLYFKNLAGENPGFQNNLGIKDQIMALKWVHENIANFGGDPNNVTIFGESAGARSVIALLGAPAANGLFQRAIAQSATPDFSYTPEEATLITKTFLDILKIPYNELDRLKKLPVDTLINAVSKLDEKLSPADGWNKVFTPTIDDEFDLYGNVARGKVDLLIGTNRDESNLFATKQMGMMPSKAEGLKPYLVDMDTADVNRIIKSYKNYPNKNAVLQILTDAIFRIPSIDYADLHAENASVYMYRFDWCSFPLKMVGLRSFHGLELAFVFGNNEAALSKKMLVMANKRKVKKLSEVVQTAWINFARTGNPNDDGKNLWPAYSPQNRATWIFDNKCHLQIDPDSVQRKAWVGVDFK